jgi:DNA-binding NarL/FixJ family response regulator
MRLPFATCVICERSVRDGNANKLFEINRRAETSIFIIRAISLATILLADDHARFREEVRKLLPEFEVVGAVSNGSDALAEAARLRPDILVLDIEMPELGGVQVARALCSKGAACKIVMLTMHEDDDYIQSAIQAGASGYVFKSRVRSDLLFALQEVQEGRSFISPQSVRRSQARPY